MIALWIVIGLILAALSVASLAALFSIVGLAALFSGAWLAVCAMAGSLEFAKFVLAAYLHQRWNEMNKALRTYLTAAIVILSLITSMGVFGFLSDAYQSTSTLIQAEEIKLQTERNKQASFTNEIARLEKSINEIPDSRITKKLKAREAAEPAIKDLNTRHAESEKTISEINLHVLEIKKKVGPLVYISKAFNVDIDSVVKYLILIFVLVFDPLAICLVIAATQALDSRRKRSILSAEAPLTTESAEPKKTVLFETTAKEEKPEQKPEQKISAALPEKKAEQEDLIEMRYATDLSEEDKTKNKVV